MTMTYGRVFFRMCRAVEEMAAPIIGIRPMICLFPENKKAVTISSDRFNIGRPCGIRTCDQRIKSPLLYQLS
jgi:hypothetical protein